MDMYEFQESDVMFSDYSSDQSLESNDNDSDLLSHHYNQTDASRMMMKRRKSLIPKKPMRISSSAPVNIPGKNSFRYDIDVAGFELFDQEYSDDEDHQMLRLPPHLIVERRVNGEMARSFSPLKGRNLYEVRNSVLRMTGFLER